VEVRGEEIFIDFTGTCPQVMRNVNCPLSSTHSAALNCVKSVASDGDIPYNEGVKRPIHIVVPPGTLLNPTHPAPVRARMEAAYRAFNAIMKALAQAVPGRVIASGFDTTAVICFSRHDAAGYHISLEIFGGGYGASAHADGCDAVDSPLSNCSNTPVEALDAEHDFLRVIAHQLEPDSFGHGAQRGGAGFSRHYAILHDDVKLELYADRFRLQPDGLFGGTPAGVGRCIVQRGAQCFDVGSKSSTWLRAGDIVTLICGGGAGYGDPLARSHEAVRRDIDAGLLTPGLAKTIYGYAA
jgi:N-methylhydantoinase B